MPVMRFLVQSGNELHITKRTFKDVFSLTLNFLQIQRQKLHKLSYFDFLKCYFKIVSERQTDIILIT